EPAPLRQRGDGPPPRDPDGLYCPLNPPRPRPLAPPQPDPPIRRQRREPVVAVAVGGRLLGNFDCSKYRPEGNLKKRGLLPGDGLIGRYRQKCKILRHSRGMYFRLFATTQAPGVAIGGLADWRSRSLAVSQ